MNSFSETSGKPGPKGSPSSPDRAAVYPPFPQPEPNSFWDIQPAARPFICILILATLPIWFIPAAIWYGLVKPMQRGIWE